MKAPIRVIAADDHGVVCRGLMALLSARSDIHLVATASGGRTAVALCAEHQPDVVLLDIIMPDMDGIRALREIRSLSPATRVIILTSDETRQTVLEATRAGAASYLLKDTEPEALIAAILDAVTGKTAVSPRVAALLMNALSRRGADRPLHEALSEREMQVFLLLAQGLGNAAIAARLGIGDKTVKSHVSNILAKLFVSDRTQAVAYAWRHGLLS